MNFNQYYSSEQIQDILESWSKTYPGLVSLLQIGHSHEQRPIWLLAITSKQTGGVLDKPALWIDANIHATELAGSTTVLLIAEHLLTDYGNNEVVTNLLDTCVFYLVPRVNPDGAAWAMAENPRFIRSGVRTYP